MSAMKQELISRARSDATPFAVRIANQRFLSRINTRCDDKTAARRALDHYFRSAAPRSYARRHSIPTFVSRLRHKLMIYVVIENEHTRARARDARSGGAKVSPDRYANVCEAAVRGILINKI